MDWYDRHGVIASLVILCAWICYEHVWTFRVFSDWAVGNWLLANLACSTLRSCWCSDRSSHRALVMHKQVFQKNKDELLQSYTFSSFFFFYLFFISAKAFAFLSDLHWFGRRNQPIMFIWAWNWNMRCFAEHMRPAYHELVSPLIYFESLSPDDNWRRFTVSNLLLGIAWLY